MISLQMTDYHNGLEAPLSAVYVYIDAVDLGKQLMAKTPHTHTHTLQS